MPDFTGHDPEVVMVPRCGRCRRWLEPVVGGPVDGPAYRHQATLDDQQAALVARGKAEREARAAAAKPYTGERTKCQAKRYVRLGRFGDFYRCNNWATKVREDREHAERPVCGVHARADTVTWQRDTDKQ